MSTLHGFCGAFYALNKRAPTNQEIFDEGVAEGKRRATTIPSRITEPAAWMNPNEPYSCDAFLWARDEDCSPEYSVPVYATPASPAASVLSEDAILAIAIDHGLGTAVVESIVKALLAASMGGGEK